MNREEKNSQKRQVIIDSAFKEFSDKSYNEASLNNICTSGNISKGIIYHYFEDKDELYLICVKECFDALTDYLKSVIVDDINIEPALQRYFDARISFFNENPLYLGVFCSAVMNPPGHLLEKIQKTSAEFNALSVSILTKLLINVKLCPGVTLDEIVEVFCEYQDFVNTRFQMEAANETALRVHEQRCRKSLHILLYGAIEREV